MYIKGQNKRDEIYENAKSLLYEHGYLHTTMKRIADKSNSPVSLVHYYFKKKDEIIKVIYNDFNNNIHDFVHKHIPNENNSILIHAVSSRIYYHIILNNENNKRLYFEVLSSKSNYRILSDYVSEIYRKYILENDLDISDELFYTYNLMEFGARREFFIDYFQGNSHLSNQEIVTTLNGHIPRLYKMDPCYIDTIMTESIKIFDSLDFSEITFLV